MKFFILTTICLCSLTFSAKATDQFGEQIIIGRDTLEMLTYPLDADTLLARQVSKRLSGKGITTALWRGYIGLWRLEEGKLYLEKLEERYTLEPERRVVNIDGIFDAYREKDGRILAGWFSGKIRVVEGERVSFRQMRDYERETIYTLRNGKVKSRKEIHNSLRKSANASFEYTMFSLFNEQKMRRDSDSLLRIELLPRPDGTVDRMKLTYELRHKVERAMEKYQARYERLKRRGKLKKMHRVGANFPRPKVYGRHHPAMQEARACADLMGDWEVLTLDGKIQPIRFSIWCGRDRSKLDLLPEQTWGRRDSLELLDMEGETWRVNAFPLQQDAGVMTRLRPYLKGAFTTENPRGYRARWKIADDRLWLTEIRHGRTGQQIPLSVLVPGNDGSPIEASWYTGNLMIARGGVIAWGTERYEIAYKIEQGRILHRTVYDNYIRPGDEMAYNRLVQELRSHNWERYPELKDRSLYGSFWVYPRLDGQADSIGDIGLVVSSRYYEDPYYHRKISDLSDPWIMLVRRAAEAVKRWEVRFLRGKVRPVYIDFEIRRKTARP